MNCCDFRLAVSITLKTKIRYNGQEYSSPAELPPDVRVAYEEALHDGVKKKFVFNGEQFASEEAMPADLRKLLPSVWLVRKKLRRAVASVEFEGRNRVSRVGGSAILGTTWPI